MVSSSGAQQLMTGVDFEVNRSLNWPWDCCHHYVAPTEQDNQVTQF